MANWASADATAEEGEPAWEAEGPSEPREKTEPDVEPAYEDGGAVEPRLPAPELRSRISISCSTLTMTS